MKKGEGNDLGEAMGEGHIEITVVITMENNSHFSGIEPLSVPRGIFIVFLLYLT